MEESQVPLERVLESTVQLVVRVPQFDSDTTGNFLHKKICKLVGIPDGVNVSRVSGDVLVVCPSKFFLMERAGRRKLLLTGFICIAVCNLLTTITDSVLVGSTRNLSL